MSNISTLLFKVIDDKGLLYVAGLLGHDSTSIIERWRKEGSIPEGKKWGVQEILKKEGYIQ